MKAMPFCLFKRTECAAQSTSWGCGAPAADFRPNAAGAPHLHGIFSLSLWILSLELTTMTAFGGSVLVYRNAGWRITDWKYHAGTTPPAGGRDAWRQPNFDD